MRSADDLLANYARTRDQRDMLRDARNKCLCERHEGVEWEGGLPVERIGTPCWKAARHWSDGFGENGTFYLDPPPGQWCHSCRARQGYTEQLRDAVRRHAVAKRSLLQRGRALARPMVRQAEVA